MKKTFLLLSVLCLVTLAAFAALTPTTSTIGFSPNPVIQGDSETITATVTPAPAPGTGNLFVEQLVDNLTQLPVACGSFDANGAANDTYITVAGPASGVGTLGYSADTSQVGSFGYRAHFAVAASGLAESKSACANLNVIVPACEGLHISAANAFAAGVASPGPFSGGFTITVTNCGPGIAHSVTAQGGTSAWTTMTSYSQSTGSVGVRKSTGGGNKILLWTIGDMDPNTSATLTIYLSGNIKPTTPDNTVLNLNGGWSAISDGVKTNYTDQITITVTNPGY